MHYLDITAILLPMRTSIVAIASTLALLLFAARICFSGRASHRRIRTRTLPQDPATRATQCGNRSELTSGHLPSQSDIEAVDWLVRLTELAHAEDPKAEREKIQESFNRWATH